MITKVEVKQPLIKPVGEYVKENKQRLDNVDEDWEKRQIACEIADRILHDRDPNTQHWVNTNDRDYTHYNADSQKDFDYLYLKVMDFIEP